MLAQLKNIQEDKSVILMCVQSKELELFACDLIQKSLDCTSDTCRELKTSKDVKKARADALVEPFNCNTWVFILHCDKREQLIKEVKKSLSTNVAGVYVLVTEKYGTYKKVCEMMKDFNISANYLGRLCRQDVVFLYDSLVKEEYKIDSRLLSYFCDEYRNDIDSMFKLFGALNEGEQVKTTSDITSICGLSNVTIPKFAIGLLDSKIKSELSNAGKDLNDEDVVKNINRGRKIIINNKIKQMQEMRDEFDCMYIHKVVLDTICALCDMKILYINGSLYKNELREEDTEGYDITQLNRGMKFWFRISGDTISKKSKYGERYNLPMSRLIELRVLVEENPWRCELDFCKFLYNYYK